MASRRGFWVDVGLLLLVELGAAAGLYRIGRLDFDGPALTDVGPLAVGPVELLLGIFAIGAFFISLHGWFRRGRGAAGFVDESTTPVADLFQLVMENPPGSVPAGEPLDKHLANFVETARTVTRADGAALEIIEDGAVTRAYAAGSLEPYKGVGLPIRGTITETALQSKGPIEWKPQATPEAPSAAGTNHQSMLLAPLRIATHNLAVLRFVSNRSHAFKGEIETVEIMARYAAEVLWKAPEKALEVGEAEKVAAERAGAKAAATQLAGVVQALDSVIWITEPNNGNVLVVNPTYERVWGRSADRLYRSPRAWIEAVRETDREAVTKAMSAPEGDVVEASYAVSHKDGSEVSIAHRRFPLRDEAEALIGIANIATDMTEAWQLAADLEEMRRHTVEVSETSPVIAYGARPGGDYGLTFVTPNVQAQLGYSGKSFLDDATFWSAHLHPEDQTRVFEGFAKLFEKGRLVQEYRFRHADGTYHNISDASRLVRSAEGEPVEIVGYWFDITEKKRAEEGMAYSLNRIKDLQESRTRLLNSIAHDLSSPLTPIGLQIHLIQSRKDLPEELKRPLEVVARNVDHMGLLVRDLKDVALLEGGQLKVDMAAADVAAIARQAVESFQEPAKEKGLTLKGKVAKTLPATVDGQRLNQVLFNFLTNALKFTPVGGTITVEASKKAKEITVKVTDTGRGLAREEIDKLFKPFSQVHDRSLVQEKGSGLGLYICKGLIEKHKGQIWVESRGLGKGSTFAFSLPVAA